jgi:hypothetical protein
MSTIFNQFGQTEDGSPTGGFSKARGVDIRWQDGPLGNGANRVEPNGAFVEEVIQIAIDRLSFFNESKFRSRENSLAITKLEEAIHWLNHRTARRERAGIEGTHQEDPEAQS